MSSSVEGSGQQNLLVGRLSAEKTIETRVGLLRFGDTVKSDTTEVVA